MLLLKLKIEIEKQKSHEKKIFEWNNLHNLHDCDAVKNASKTILNEHDDRCRTILGLLSFCNCISINDRSNSSINNSSS